MRFNVVFEPIQLFGDDCPFFAMFVDQFKDQIVFFGTEFTSDERAEDRIAVLPQ